MATTKTALVTGASRGIGKAAALAIAAKGFRVLVHYSNSAAEAEAVVTTIRNNGGSADVVKADFTRAEAPFELAAAVKDLSAGHLDVLIANAGVAGSATIEDQKIEDFDRLFAVNVRAPFFLVQQLLPIMSEGGSIVLTSSLAAHASVGNLSAYGATKGAVSTLVKHFASALGPRGIRVNGVAPGVVATDMSSFTKTPEGEQFTLSIQALKRLAQAEDIGAVMAFLASDESRWISGDILNVDGGSKL